jgi:hypothetical protein
VSGSVSCAEGQSNPKGHATLVRYTMRVINTAIAEKIKRMVPASADCAILILTL